MTLQIGKNQCPVDELLKHVKGHKCLDCGKCVFGYEGATQLRLMLEDITNKRSRPDDLARMKRLAGLMAEQSLCEDGEELGKTVLELLETSEEEFDRHIAKKGCTAGVCKKFVSYYILMDKCVGCGDCVDECEEDAIQGKPRFIHVINQTDCTQCGKCVSACEEGAIITAGADKPRVPPRPIPCRR